MSNQIPLKIKLVGMQIECMKCHNKYFISGFLKPGVKPLNMDVEKLPRFDNVNISAQIDSVAAN